MFANIQETLLMYTKQKDTINAKLSDVMMDMLSATRKNAEMQEEYNQKMQDVYYDPTYGYCTGSDEYIIIMEDMENEHQCDLANLESWESELDLEKNNLETQLNELTSFESSWTKLENNNIKSDMTYGSVGGQ